MTQITLILWKDVRFLWRELGVYLVVLAVFALVEPHTWPERAPSPILLLFANALKFLIAITWVVLIARVVHADSLVGEEQFWLTRPYRWQSMLGAKLLFLAVCIAFPFLLMQWSILLTAGLNPFEAKAGMATSLTMFLLINWLPFTVIASVTDGLAAAFTAAVGVVVVWGGMLTFVMTGVEGRTSAPYGWLLIGAPISALLFAILCYQYARRRTGQSRLLIAGALALFLLLVFGLDNAGFGAPVKALIRAHYPMSQPIRLKRLGDVPYDERSQDMRVPRNYMEIKLPLELQGSHPGDKLRDTSVSIALDSGDLHFAPQWQTATLTEHSIGFLLPERVFNAFVGKGAKLHLELIGEDLRSARVLQSTVGQEFAGPFHGICLLVDGKVHCRYAYQELPVARMEANTCIGPVSARLRSVRPGTNLDPVVEEVLPVAKKACVGDRIRFEEYELAGRFRVAFEEVNLRIEQYRTR